MNKEIDRYLRNEMTDSEREKFETAFFADDGLFYEITERENELVDAYATRRMAGPERDRFERSLADLPARRQKVANARLLSEFIDEQRPEIRTVSIDERTGVFSRIFSFRSPALQFASIAAISVLALLSIFLLIENRRLGSLEQELAESHRRESELTSQIESERDSTGALTSDLDAERERIRQLEVEVEKLRGSTGSTTSASPPSPTIATLILSPVLVRGGPAKSLKLPAGVSRVSIVVNLPDDAPSVQRAAIRINGELISDRVNIRNGKIVVAVERSRLKAGRNQLVVSAADGTEIGEYPFSVVDAE